MAVAKTERRAVAERNWIDADGNEVDDEKLATGFSYVHKASGKSFTRQFGNPGTTNTMLCIFGGLTLCGNIVNTWDKTPKGDREYDEAIDAVAARFKQLDEGEWVVRTGFGGPRYDAEALAKAIAVVKKDEAYAVVAAKRIAEEKGYGNMSLKVPQVLHEYNKLTGKGSSVADL